MMEIKKIKKCFKKAKKNGKRNGIPSFLFAFGLSAIIFYGAFQVAYLSVLYKTSGETTIGKVTHMEIQADGDEIIEYTFTTKSDDVITRRLSVTPSLYKSLHVGGELAIDYIPSHPEENIATKDNMPFLFSLFFASILCFLGCIPWYYFFCDNMPLSEWLFHKW